MKHRKYFSAGVTAAIAFLAITSASQAQAVNATQTSTAIFIDDVLEYTNSYNINGNNYYKLRDLAFELSGSVNNFDVIWNQNKNQVEIITGKDYSSAEESNSSLDYTVEAIPSNSKLIIDGKETNVTAYSINGNNYYKLRDLGEALGFDVYWKETTGNIFIYTLNENIVFGMRSTYNPRENFKDMDLGLIVEKAIEKEKMSGAYSKEKWANIVKSYLIDNNDGTFYVFDKKYSNDNYIYIDTYDSKTYQLLSTQKV